MDKIVENQNKAISMLHDVVIANPSNPKARPALDAALENLKWMEKLKEEGSPEMMQFLMDNQRLAGNQGHTIKIPKHN